MLEGLRESYDREFCCKSESSVPGKVDNYSGLLVGLKFSGIIGYGDLEFHESKITCIKY